MTNRALMLLSSCAVNDVLYIRQPNKHNGISYIGSIILEKIKSIPGGGIQIKYRNKNWMKNSTIQKATFKQDLMVENEGPYVPPLVKPVTVVDINVVKNGSVTPEQHILDRIIQHPQFAETDLILSPRAFTAMNFVGAQLSTVLAESIRMSGGELKCVKDDR